MSELASRSGDYILKIYRFVKSHLQSFLSAAILYVLIPIAAFYAISFYTGNLYSIVLFSLILSSVMSILGWFCVQKEPAPQGLMSCLFGYYNIGWFGIPAVSVIYGNEGVFVIAAAYIGGVIYGNTIAVASIRGGLEEGVKKLFRLPATYAVVAALGNRYVSFISQENLELVFLICKNLLSLCGIGLIGIAVFSKPFKQTRTEIETVWPFLGVRILYSAASLAVLLGVFYYFNLIYYFEMKVLSIIFILPIATNVIILEYSLAKTSISSKYILGSTLISMPLILVYYMLMS